MQSQPPDASLDPMPHHRRHPIEILLLLSLGAALGAVAVLWLEHGHPHPPAATAAGQPAARAEPGDGSAATDSYREAVARAAPAVVNLYASHLPRPGAEGERRPTAPGGRTAPGPGIGLGAAVVIDAGLLVSNGHLLAGADRIDARLADGRALEVRLLGIDPATDLAVLTSTDPNLPPPLSAADPHQLAVGDLVLAIGNPFGMGQTVSLGVVGAIGRHHLGLTEVERFIQTDAAINPGSSGGALIDSHGQLVGINTAILSETGVSAGIGFAIPVDLIFEVVGRIRRNGRGEPGWIGIGGRSVTPVLAERFGLRTATGVLVSSVTEDSPADLAGLRPGDVVTGLDGEVVGASAMLREAIARSGPDATITLELWRGSERLEVRTTTGMRPTETAAATPTGSGPRPPAAPPSPSGSIGRP